jgi:hypothetical protein
MTQAATHCQVPRAWQPTKQERLRTMLLEMPLTRAELVERTGWAAKQVDKAIEDAMRQGSVIPLNLPGRTRRRYAVPGFVPDIEGMARA